MADQWLVERFKNQWQISGSFPFLPLILIAEKEKHYTGKSLIYNE